MRNNAQTSPMPTPLKRRKPYDIESTVEDIVSVLPGGQRRAMTAIIGGVTARTYKEAAAIAGMSLGTLLTHVNRVRQRYPEIYRLVRIVRRTQLRLRHNLAVQNARSHSREWFKRVRRNERLALGQFGVVNVPLYGSM